MFKFIKNKFLWWRVRQEQKKRQLYKQQFNELLRDVLDKITTRRYRESLILSYSQEDFSYQIVYDVFIYLKSIGYNVLFSQHDVCDQMIEKLVQGCCLSFKFG
jgi:hypothetical protein